jgi:hypothetical protein
VHPHGVLSRRKQHLQINVKQITKFEEFHFLKERSSIYADRVKSGRRRKEEVVSPRPISVNGNRHRIFGNWAI